HAVRRQDQEEPLISSYRFVDLLMYLLSGLYIVRREPAADAVLLQIGMQASGEFLILGGIADEAGIELKGLPCEGSHVLDEVVGNTGPAQECQRDVSMRAVDGVDADRRRTVMVHGLKALYVAQVVVSENRIASGRICEVGPGEVGPAEVRPGEVRPAEVRLDELYREEVCQKEVRPGEVRPGEVRPAEVRLAEAGHAEVCAGEARAAEVRAGKGSPRSGSPR